MTPARLLRLLLSLLLAVAAVVLGGLSAHRKIQSFQPLGFTLSPVSAGQPAVATVEDAKTGLAPGDRILLAGGAEAAGGIDIAGATALLHALAQEPETPLTVLRGAEVVAVTYHRPPLAVDYAYLLVALIGVGYLLIGLYTLSRQGGGASFLFFLWCLASAVLYLLTPVPPVDALFKASFLGDELCRLLLPALTLHLFLVFPSPLEGGRRLRAVMPFLYLPAALLAWLQLRVASAAEGRLLDRLEMIHFAVFAVFAVAVLVGRLLSQRDWEERRQLRWVTFGLAGGYLPFLAIYGLPFALGLKLPAAAVIVAIAPLGLVPLTFAWAILRYKLWDVEVIVRDTISATLTLMLGILGFSLVNLAIVRGVSPNLAMARNLFSFAGGLGIAGLLVPTRRGISSALERLQYRGTFGKRQALAELGRELLLERDLGRLCTALLGQIEEGVAVDRANLYLAQGDTLVAVRPETSLPARLPANALGDGLWRENVVRLAGSGLPTEPTAPAQQLFAAGYRYAFPLAVLGGRVGIVLTGHKQDGNPLNSEDSGLIRHLLNQAALAIENAQLLGQLHQQLAEVVRLQRYSEGIFESSPAGIAVLDAGGRVVSANAAFVAIAGEGEHASLVGRTLAEVLPVESLPAPGETPVEVSFCDAAGDERHLQLSVSEFAGDPTIGVSERLRILVVHDVSERVAMESSLKEKDRLAALGMLAAGVAHEVNTPITGISSYAQMLLADTAESDPRYEILKKVERQTFRAARIVNNLLEFARNRQDERRPVALGGLVAESLDLLADRLTRRHVVVERTTPAEPVVVFGSDGELQQVFTNLFSNAIDAMGEAGGTLTVAIEADEARARVRVADTGPGIPPERLDKIFQPFFSTKLTRGGTGLGLSISHEIVRRHGGELRVAAALGGGACFVVELPRTTSAAA